MSEKAERTDFELIDALSRAVMNYAAVLYKNGDVVFSDVKFENAWEDRSIAWADLEMRFEELRLQDERDGGWQDIATAPKGGSAWFKDSDIDLWHRDQGRVANCFWRKEYQAWFARSGGRTFNMGGDEKFSHWMPLPRPPHSKDSEG